MRIRDGKNWDPGSEINIPDPQRWFVVSSLKILARSIATNPPHDRVFWPTV